MDSNNSGDRSERLETLVQQLCHYNAKQQITKTENETSSSQNSSSVAVSSTKRAAVLVCLFEGNDGDLRVFLTKRSSTLSSHAGEVALPGGKREETDADDVETALREAKEEIGLDSSLVDVVTVLEPFVTKNGMTVVPVISILPNRKAFIPAPSAAEVDTIFDAPLEMFLKDENRRAEEKEWMGNKYLLHYFDYEAEGKKYVIWALTAGILIHAASVVYQRPPAFLERRPKFWSGSCS
ncbi:nudix hydrolase 15, mitochondrial-like [Melia azedarach]|uniref:Nudix hydrolase 15, mitochondrial-like n=1 Tax=Melia azedarach TaxID=155640 RepID=A0ACC1WY88_MELAZ|nr:nudix hydrolase 15, mitochondrial-like [Melia azedarach]